jgi:predicted MFS family arabinose efflux permease
MSYFPDLTPYSYEIIEELDRQQAGGVVTYLAENLDTQELVVIQQLPAASQLKSADFQMRSLPQPNHPRILGNLDAFTTSEGHFRVRQYQKALSLAPAANFTPAQIKQIAVSTLEILVDLQARSPAVILTHLQPENILVDDQMNVYLAGLENNCPPDYLAPELAQGNSPTAATALYSLGISLIIAIQSTPISNLIDENRKINFKPLREFSSDFSHWLEKMVAPEPKNRFENAASALEVLQTIPPAYSTPSTLSEEIAPTDNQLSESMTGDLSADILLPSGQGFTALIKNRSFMFLWGGQVVSQVADKVFFVLLIALLETYRSPAALENSMRSALMISLTLPAILFGSLAGAIVDIFPKKQIMVISDLLRGILTLAIPFLPKEFLLLLVMTFLISTITQIFAPAEQAAIPMLVKPENLMSANALFTTTMMGSLIVGFAIGDPVLSVAKFIGGDYAQEFLVAGLYFLAAILGQMIGFKEPKSNYQSLNKNPWRDFKSGLNYLWNQRLIRDAMLQLTILYSTFAALTVLAIPLSTEIGLKETQFGFLLAAAGVGLLLGAGMLGHWGDRWQNKPLPLIGFISIAFVLGVFSFTHRLDLGLVLSALVGLGAALIAVPMQTLIHQKTPESMRGKVFGFQNNAVNIALSAPLAIAGPLTDRFGLQNVLFAMSVVVAGSGIWAWKSTRKALEDVV